MSMKPHNVREEREAVNGSLTVWRPWQIKQLELFHGVAVSTPYRQYLTQEYLLVSGRSGTVHLQYRRNMYVSNQITDGMLMVIEPGETWRCQTKDFTFYHLAIDPAWLHRFASELFHREPSLLHFPRHPLFDPSLCRAVRDLAASSLAPASLLQQVEMLQYLLASLLFSHTEDADALPEPGWENPAIKRTKEYLEVHYAQEVALQELADVVNMSPFHLTRVFRRTVGMPPHAYQTQLRLDHARTLLAQGYDAGYVAQETGFFDQTHFTKQFKRRYFVTPGSYRKTAGFS